MQEIHSIQQGAMHRYRQQCSQKQQYCCVEAIQACLSRYQSEHGPPFKNKYLEAVMVSPSTVVSHIHTVKHGMPLALSKFDAEVQKFV